MSNQFKIQISSVTYGIPQRDQISEEVKELVKLIKCPVSFLNHIQNERLEHESIKQTFERVELELEEKTGLRHYGSYESFRVIKCRLQKRKGIGQNQGTLF